MKNLRVMLTGAVLLATQANSEGIESRFQVAPVEEVFTIRGFDNNDFVEVVAYGKLPSTCYKLGSSLGTVDKAKKEVTVGVNSIFYEKDICIPMEIPYYRVVKLGVMDSGEYSVKAIANEIKPTVLRIGESSSSTQDDHLYAPVTSANIITDASTHSMVAPRPVIQLKGKFPLMLQGCMAIKEVKDYYTPENVVVVLPIAEIKPDNQCSNAKRDFVIRHPLAYDIKTPSLVHIRVMNGDAINQIVE